MFPWKLGAVAAAATILLTAVTAAVPQVAPSYPPDYRLQPFRLPDPRGRHSVGTASFEVPTGSGDLLRVIGWYPADRAGGAVAPYLDAEERSSQAPAVARNFGWPTDVLRDVAWEPTHSQVAAAVAPGRYPLIIFSHGLLSYPRQNTALMERLAAAGYVVLSLAHPGDAADLPTARGIIRTVPPTPPTAAQVERLQAYWSGRDHAARAAALPGFWKAVEETGAAGRLARWSQDIRALADAVRIGRVPNAARGIVAAADVGRIAYMGMSFGGSASVSACATDRRCRAAVNLDGFEFDPRLYDARLAKPLLLIQSDWTTFPNMGPPGAGTIYDYAYERWRATGSDPDVLRFRVSGVRHLGLTDLVLAPHDPVRDRMFGPADGTAVVDGVDDLVVAFFDRYLAGREVHMDAVAARLPGLVRHRPTPVSLKPAATAGRLYPSSMGDDHKR